METIVSVCVLAYQSDINLFYMSFNGLSAVAAIAEYYVVDNAAQGNVPHGWNRKGKQYREAGWSCFFVWVCGFVCIPFTDVSLQRLRWWSTASVERGGWSIVVLQLLPTEGPSVSVLFAETRKRTRSIRYDQRTNEQVWFCCCWATSWWIEGHSELHETGKWSKRRAFSFMEFVGRDCKELETRSHYGNAVLCMWFQEDEM